MCEQLKIRLKQELELLLSELALDCNLENLKKIHDCLNKLYNELAKNKCLSENEFEELGELISALYNKIIFDKDYKNIGLLKLSIKYLLLKLNL
jgi:hypothetical protein